jgi:hypothetical protein
VVEPVTEDQAAPEIRHSVTVTEHHQVSEPALDIAASTPRRRDEYRREAWQRCRDAAWAWANSVEPDGVEIEVHLFDDGKQWGVRFDVVIGTGQHDGDPDAWIWSPRWRDLFARLGQVMRRYAKPASNESRAAKIGEGILGL